MKSLKLIIILLLLISIKNLYSQWGTNTNVFINAGGNSFQSAGIGTALPDAPLHIIGDGVANAQGWNKAIILDKNAALIWKGSTNSYFMAHPSNNPVGVEISKY